MLKKRVSLKKEITTLYRISKFIDSLSDLRELLKLIMEESKKIVNAEASSLLLYDKEKDELYFEVALGKKGKKVKEIRLKTSEGIAGAAARKKKSVNIGNVKRSSLWDREADKISGFKTHSLLAVPMLRKNELVGVIEVLNKKSAPLEVPPTSYRRAVPIKNRNLLLTGFTHEDVQIMEILAEQAALCIENARLYEESLRAARMAAIGQTMAELSHYIKNVLAGFEGAGELLETGLEKENRELMEKGWFYLKKSQGKIASLVMNMLTYSKEKKLIFSLCDLNKVVGDVISLMEPKLKEKFISIEKHLDGNIGKIVIDSDGIYNSVLNLVSNAMDAIEDSPRSSYQNQRSENGKITINTLNDPRNKQVRIEIKDNGNGIPREQINDVFELFCSSKRRGTGLGLAVTKKIVDEHKGKITVESQEGKGTKFTITLPTNRLASKRVSE